MNLFINPYINPIRDEEFKECLRRNEENKFIDRIIYMREGERATIQDFFNLTRNYPHDINILANLDIYFDDTLEYAERVHDMECFALTRWEDINGRLVTFRERHNANGAPPAWSQDAWIFRGEVKIKRGFEMVYALNERTRQSQNIEFTLGIPGCDNKLAAMLRLSGYNVVNPSSEVGPHIKAIHLHADSSRYYGDWKILAGIKPYGKVDQTTL